MGHKALQEAVLVQLLYLNARLQGVVVGLVAGLGVFVATNWLVLKGGDVVGPHLALLGQFFIGYRVSFLGSLIGFAYGFGFGYVTGYCAARLYNSHRPPARAQVAPRVCHAQHWEGAGRDDRQIANHQENPVSAFRPQRAQPYRKPADPAALPPLARQVGWLAAGLGLLLAFALLVSSLTYDAEWIPDAVDVLRNAVILAVWVLLLALIHRRSAGAIFQFAAAGARLADRHGGKLVLAFCLVLTGVIGFTAYVTLRAFPNSADGGCT